MIHKRKKWTVAASAMGYHAGYGSPGGFFGGKGGIKTGKSEQKLQTGVKLKEAPARSTAMFSPYYKTKKMGKDGLLVKGLQKWCQIGYDNTGTAANKQWCFINTQTNARTNFLEINPDAINGAITTDAQSYQYFLMDHFKVIFVVPSTSYTLSAGTGGTPVMTPNTLDNVNMSVGYFSDDNISSLETIDYNALQASNNMFEHQMISPWGGFSWVPKNQKVRQVKWLNTELTQSTAADKHMCCQGIIYGFYDQNVFTTASTGTQNFKIGDVYIEYSMKLKGRISTNGITAEIQSKAASGAIYDALKNLDEKKKQEDKDGSYNSNSLLRRFEHTMKRMKSSAYSSDPVPSNVTVQTTKVIIVDSKYDGSDATKLATVTSNQLSCAATGSGTQDVNIKQIAGTTTVSSSGYMPTDLKRVAGSAVNSFSGLLNVGVPNGVAIQDGTSIGGMLVNSGAANVGLAGIGGATISSPYLPVDIQKIQGAVLNTADNGVPVNGALPVQIYGRYGSDSFVTTNVANVFTNGSGVTGVITAGMSEPDTKSVSPTESLDGFVTLKKKDYKAALKRGLETPIKIIGGKAVIDPIDKSVVNDIKGSKK